MKNKWLKLFFTPTSCVVWVGIIIFKKLLKLETIFKIRQKFKFHSSHFELEMIWMGVVFTTWSQFQPRITQLLTSNFDSLGFFVFTSASALWRKGASKWMRRQGGLFLNIALENFKSNTWSNSFWAILKQKNIKKRS